MLAILAIISAGAAAFEFTDPFDYADGSDGAPAWLTETVAWRVQEGQMRAGNTAYSAAVLDQAPFGKAVTVVATVIPRERRNPEAWAIAGLSIQWDSENYWHLALVEAPAERGAAHYVELGEMLDGHWLADAAEATRLTPLANEGLGFNWAYGHAYRFKLVLSATSIEGAIADADSGAQVGHLAFALDNRAVGAGRPALACAHLEAAFDDFAATVNEEVSAPSLTFPPYTGPAREGTTSEATGAFRVAEIEGRAWLIDPLGRAFYAVGTDHVRYDGHWCEALGYAPYNRIAAAKYGSEEKWCEATLDRLKEWGFNTLTAGHSVSLRHKRFPHIEFLGLGSSFSEIDDLCPKTTWTGFPNVFSQDWPRHCDKLARRICASMKEDPWLLGYFLDNELEWFGKGYLPWGLFDEAWKKPASHTAKQAWVRFLQEELASPAEFEELWSVPIADFAALAAHTEPRPPKNERARAVAQAWVRRVAEEYFRVCEEAIRRHDSKHLILGCRFAGQAPGIWDITGQHCDVVSFNMYPQIDFERGDLGAVRRTIEEWHTQAGKPLMITEWSFPALDSGLPCKHGAGMRVDTQAQRTRCFSLFQRLMFSLPFMVGSDFFMYLDQPAQGISSSFPEDSNYGLITGEDEPYAELTAEASRLNAQVYALHKAGQVPPDLPAPAYVPWLTEAPAESLAMAANGVLRLSAGDLALEGPAGREAWKLSYKGQGLGAFHALLHQRQGDSRWVGSDSARIAASHQNEKVTVVDMELSFGAGEKATDPAAANAPRHFRTAWRFWVPRTGGAWLASQCLQAENIDGTAWMLDSVFHYIAPNIAGSQEGDRPFGPDVPNYYRYSHGAAYYDDAAKLGLACWYTEEDAFTCRFWKDAGGFHSDLFEPVNADLAPGARIELPGALAFFFPLDDIPAAALGQVAAPVIREVLLPASAQASGE